MTDEQQNEIIRMANIVIGSRICEEEAKARGDDVCAAAHREAAEHYARRAFECAREFSRAGSRP